LVDISIMAVFNQDPPTCKTAVYQTSTILTKNESIVHRFNRYLSKKIRQQQSRLFLILERDLPVVLSSCPQRL